MTIDVPSLIKSMLAAATSAAGPHADDLKDFLTSHAETIAAGIAQIPIDLEAGRITQDDVQFSFDQLKEEEENALPAAIDVAVKTAAQDAINAALNVAAAVASKAIGIPLTL
jgi:hypothetical protein